MCVRTAVDDTRASEGVSVLGDAGAIPFRQKPWAFIQGWRLNAVLAGAQPQSRGIYDSVVHGRGAGVRRARHGGHEEVEAHGDCPGREESRHSCAAFAS